jgi:hypothetical protein
MHCRLPFLCSTRSHCPLTATFHLHPFTAPNSAAPDAWRHMHSRFPDQCPPPADGFCVPAGPQHAPLPTLIRCALHTASQAELLRLYPIDRAQALQSSILDQPGSMWLDAVPYAPSLRLSDQAFQAAARVRMGIRTFSSFGNA